jgi:hypothetical protein
MQLGQRKARSHTDEAALLQRVLSGGLGVPDLLRGAAWTTWRGSEEDRARLLEALDLYQFHQIQLRTEAVSVPAWTPSPTETRRALTVGRAVLRGRDGERAELAVQDLLDANVLFARVAALRRSWQVRARAAWTPWDEAVAWAEESVDPHGGLFDLPAVRDTVGEASGPLLGWKLDLAWGARPGEHGFPVVRMNHGDRARRIPLFDVPRCYQRGQTPLERIAARPVMVGKVDRALIRTLDVSDRRATVTPWPADPSVPEVAVPISLDTLLEHTPELVGLLGLLLDQELVEHRRRIEAHAAAGGSWRVPASLRDQLVRPHLPLGGWTLAPDAFRAFAQGLVALVHPRAPDGVSISARAAVDHMRDAAAVSLWDDPCASPHEAHRAVGGLAFVRRIDEAGFWLTALPTDPGASAVALPHSVFLLANDDLLGAVLSAVPDLGAWSEDPALREALTRLDLPADHPLAEALDAQPPDLRSGLAREIAREARFRLDDPDLVHFEDAAGATWRWIAVDDDARLVFARAPAVSRGLPGPGRGDLMVATALGAIRRLTAAQVTFASPRLARAIHAWQTASAALDANGEPKALVDRVETLMRRADESLVQAEASARKHLQISRDLREDPRKSKVLLEQLDRVIASRADLRAGRWIRAWIDEPQLPRTGVAVAVGAGVGETRLRLTDGIAPRLVGRFRVLLVAGEEPGADGPIGALLTRLVDDIEGRVADALRDLVEPKEALPRARDAVLAAAAAVEQKVPFCSLVMLLEHLDSGWTGLLWSGAAVAWRVRRGEVAPLTWAQHADGIMGLAHAAALRAEDATLLGLQLQLRRTSRRDLDETDRAHLLGAADRLTQPGRRRALRAAIGGARPAMVEEHLRLQALLHTWREARGLSPEVEPVDQGAAMLFARRVRVAPGDRLVLGTRGLTALWEAEPVEVAHALASPTPQRAAERLAERVQARPDRDDLAVIVLDPVPERAWEATHTRRLGLLFRKGTDQGPLVEVGGVVPVPGESLLPALRLRPRALARWHSDIEQLLRVRRLPDPDRDTAGFVEAVARFTLEQDAKRPEARRESETLRELDEVLLERNDDLADETLLTLWLLRRRGVTARWVTGLRSRTGEPSPKDVAWLEVDINGRTWLLDLSLGGRPTLRDANAAYGKARSALSRLVGGGVVWLPRRTVVIEAQEDASVVEDPWMRLTPVADRVPAKQPQEPRTERTSAPERAVEPRSERPPPSAPEGRPAAPEPAAAAIGWLDLDDG